jgi:hypothetical protein
VFHNRGIDVAARALKKEAARTGQGLDHLAHLARIVGRNVVHCPALGDGMRLVVDQTGERRAVHAVHAHHTH